MGHLIQDVRFAVRTFRKSPGFVVTAVLSLALAIGATTAIFSVVYGVLIDPYPYKDADRMVHVELRDKEGQGPLLEVSGPGHQQLLALDAIDDVFLERSEQWTLRGDFLPVSVAVGIYSPNLFEYMGVPPLLGRAFSPADAAGGAAAPVAVLGHAFWQRQFGGNADVIGRVIRLDDSSYTVIGVARPRFTWGDADVYLPGVPSGNPREYWRAFVKLAPGATYERAEAELQGIVDEFARVDPAYPQGRHVKVVSLNELVLGRFAGTLVLLFGSVVALLLIGCANVSILLLARGAARQQELAIRVSIGAGRGRLVRQLLTESVLLALAGATLGVLMAYRGVRTIVAMLPLFSFPHEAAIEVNGIVLAFTMCVAVATGLLFGLSPAWQLSRPQLGSLMQESSLRHSGAGRARTVHAVLIAGQVALTLLLMAGAGASVRALMARLHTPLGFDPDRVVSITVAFPRGANTTWAERLEAQTRVREAVAATPGVEAASVSTTWFPPFGGFTASFEVEGREVPKDAQTMLGLVGADEFRVFRIPLVQGRLFDDAEVRRAAHVAVVNRAFVARYLQGVSPIGQRVRSAAARVEQPSLLVADGADDWLEIVGVVGDAKNNGFDRPAMPAMFLPHSFVLPPDVSLAVRTTVTPESAVPSIRQRLRDASPQAVVMRERTYVWFLETQGWGQERFVARLFGVFAVLALALAATGLYSVVSYGVTQRRREVGTRIALGAQRTSIVGLVFGTTVTTLGAGVVAGVALSVALGSVVASWAGSSSRDPLVLALSAAVLTLVAVVACIVPAWRAATIEPLEALRTD